jgi:glycosyltransferase involved in cell wall biosynthesis
VRVLIIHQHFNTPEKGGPLRSYYLSKALVDAGIEPVVITAHNEKTSKVEQVEGIEVHYLPVDYDNRFGYYKRGWAFLKFVFGAVRLASRVKKIDLCYAISAPLTVGIAARVIKMRLNVPYIFEVGDLWPDAPIQLGFIKNDLVKASLYWLEKTTYRHARCIVALSDPIKTSIEAKTPGKKVHVITNMSDTDFFDIEKKDDGLAEKYGVKGRFVVSYIGAIGVANGLEFFTDCAWSSQRAGLPVHFLICGDGALKHSIESSIKRLELRNCTILPFQNRHAVRKLLNITDAAFVCYKPYPILETGSPNKYFDGLASGKLIIVNFGGWIKEEIEKEACGVGIRNPDDIAKAISPFLNDPRLLAQFQNASKTLAERKYSRRILSGKFLDLIKDPKA